VTIPSCVRKHRTFCAGLSRLLFYLERCIRYGSGRIWSDVALARLSHRLGIEFHIDITPNHVELSA
jgi:hypothetical protein